MYARGDRGDSTVAVEPVGEFSGWADELWNRCKGAYGMSAVRDAEALRILYPEADKKFLRLRISDRSGTIGWVVMLDTQMSNHKQFGDMRVGSIVDGFASMDAVGKVVGAARDFLESRGVDLIVSNQSHKAWCRGLRMAGFLRGPTNFVFTSSPKLTRRLREHGIGDDDLHLNRGDGDGPINL
jgi:hypothetical protein